MGCNPSLLQPFSHLTTVSFFILRQPPVSVRFYFEASHLSIPQIIEKAALLPIHHPTIPPPTTSPPLSKTQPSGLGRKTASHVKTVGNVIFRDLAFCNSLLHKELRFRKTVKIDKSGSLIIRSGGVPHYFFHNVPFNQRRSCFA